MRSQNVLFCLGHGPIVVVPKRARQPILVRVLDAGRIICRHAVALGRLAEEERVVGLAGGVALRLEEGVEVPERGLHESLGGHFAEAHLEEDLAELGAGLQEWMQMSAIRIPPLRVPVLLLEG